MALTNGIGQAEQQRLNRKLVVELLRRQGLCSRAALSKASSLKRATITNIINEFIDCGLVVEDGILGGDKGRRSIGIRINGYRYRVACVMVTRKCYHIGMMGLSGEMYEVKTCPVKDNLAAKALIQGIQQDVQKMIDDAPETRVLAIGVAMPGPYRREKGEMVFITNLSGWDFIPVRSRLQQGFDIPVFVENDANAGALAQYWYGAEEEAKDLSYIVAGHGIGQGIIANGEILRGSAGIAGELGHTSIYYDGPRCECGSRGCLELYCSVLALENNIRKRIRNREDATCLAEDFTTLELGSAIQKKDALALEEYVKVCEFLAVGIVNVVNEINPSKVIIGDELAALAPEVMLEIVQNRVRRTVRPLIWEGLSIETDKLRHNSILLGAGATAIRHIFEDPFYYINRDSFAVVPAMASK